MALCTTIGTPPFCANLHTKRQRDRETERQRQRDRETETERQRDRATETHTNIDRDKDTHVTEQHPLTKKLWNNGKEEGQKR